MKILICFSLPFLLFTQMLFAQVNEYGLPQITNYTVKEYNAYSQNWVAVQNTYGLLYVGNNNGVLEYDGVHWTLIPIRNGAIIKSLAVDSLNKVYVGAEREFGYIAYNEKNVPEYTSLSAALSGEDQNFTAVFRIYVEPDGVLFCADKKIFKHTQKGIEVIQMPKGGFFTHKVHDTFYMGDYYEGLMTLNKNEFVKCPGGDAYIEKDIMAALPYANDEILLATALHGISIYNPETGTGRQPETETYGRLHGLLCENYLYGALKENDRYIFITLYGGTYICDDRFRILEHYDLKTGINDEITLACFKASALSYASPLWLCLNNGISKLAVNSKFRSFNELNGLQNEVLNIGEYKGKIYMGTSKGVYFIDKTDPYSAPQFVHVKNTEGQCWSFAAKNEHLLVGSFDIYDITDKEARVINPKNQVFKLLCSEKNGNTLYAGTEKGVLVYDMQATGLMFLKQIGGLNKHIRDMSETASGGLWLSTNNNELIKISIRENDTVITDYSQNPNFKDTRSLYFFKYNQQLLFSTDRDVLTYNENNDTFEKAAMFPAQINEALTGILHFAEDAGGNLFAVKKRNQFHELIYIENKEGGLSINPYETSEFKDHIILNIFVDSGGVLWIGTNDGLYTFRADKKVDFDKPYYTLIRSVTNNDSVLRLSFPENLEKGHIPEFPYRQNSFVFRFAAPFFIEEGKLLYTCYLEGYDKEWSEASEISFKEYTNLREGKYMFKVKAINVFGIESEEGTYTFKVLPPWYRTVYAYVAYILLFAGFVWLMVVLNTKRLRHDKQKLEQIVKERTAEILQQKEEIEAIADNLKVANDEITSKNEELGQKNRHITESIEYASKIQKALLPPDELIDELLPQHFILYKPRDIVSGDFYWLKKIGNYTVYVAADCTGHGVPGAFMSMLGISFLNEIVTKARFDKPGKILDKLRKRVKSSLRQTGRDNESKDGMDLALCVIDHDTYTLEFAGAYNPLYIIRKGELIEIGATRNPIGIFLKEKEFETQEFKLEKGDMLYTFSDGYTDQFGGDDDSKLKTKNFKKILLSIYDRPTEEQKKILEEEFLKWKGTTEQTDDIIVFGVRV